MGGGGILPWSHVVMSLYYFDRVDVLGQTTLIHSCDWYARWSCYSVMIMLFSDDHVIQWFIDDHVMQWWSCYSVLTQISRTTTTEEEEENRKDANYKLLSNPKEILKKSWKKIAERLEVREFNNKHDIVLWGGVPTRENTGYRPYTPYIRGDEEVRI